jgi:flagellar basal-body rod protein FlgB
MSTISMMEDSTVEALSRFLDVDVALYKLISANVANIDTPGYRTLDLDFRAELRRTATETEEDAFTGGELAEASFTPVAHAVRGLMERPDGNSVSLERESLLLADAQMKYNLGIQLLKDEFHSLAAAINSGGTTS